MCGEMVGRLNQLDITQAAVLIAHSKRVGDGSRMPGGKLVDRFRAPKPRFGVGREGSRVQ